MLVKQNYTDETVLSRQLLSEPCSQSTHALSGTIATMSRKTDEAVHLRDLARLRRVRDRIDREFAQPPAAEAPLD